ncbi:hypothetical protein V22_30190 [Calycomorphotria hydatis]|uniref:Uncharacterized protein n=1 Tax=Calycomorphotria hydatis TaxID=2528027 RepID=A0A517TBL2_9PLAN|nr:hypothetical protein V22_30190 [Calycomorphotria hydatis]
MHGLHGLFTLHLENSPAYVFKRSIMSVPFKIRRE